MPLPDFAQAYIDSRRQAEEDELVREGRRQQQSQFASQEQRLIKEHEDTLAQREATRKQAAEEWAKSFDFNKQQAEDADRQRVFEILQSGKGKLGDLQLVTQAPEGTPKGLEGLFTGTTSAPAPDSVQIGGHAIVPTSIGEQAKTALDIKLAENKALLDQRRQIYNETLDEFGEDLSEETKRQIKLSAILGEALPRESMDELRASTITALTNPKLSAERKNSLLQRYKLIRESDEGRYAARAAANPYTQMRVNAWQEASKYIQNVSSTLRTRLRREPTDEEVYNELRIEAENGSENAAMALDLARQAVEKPKTTNVDPITARINKGMDEAFKAQEAEEERKRAKAGAPKPK